MFSYVFGDSWFLTFLFFVANCPGEGRRRGAGTNPLGPPGPPPPTLVMTMVNDDDGDDDDGVDDDDDDDNAGDDAGDDEDRDMFLIASIENTFFKNILGAQHSRDF